MGFFFGDGEEMQWVVGSGKWQWQWQEAVGSGSGRRQWQCLIPDTRVRKTVGSEQFLGIEKFGWIACLGAC